MKLSIVATLYRSAPHLAEFVARATAAAKAYVGEDYEIVLVNDGSPDNSLELAVQHSAADAHIVVVDLSRNFGHHKAIMTGLQHASGAQVFLLDSDLEEEPEWLAPFAQQMQAEQCDVVYGVQASRKGGWFERTSGALFYKTFNAVTRLKLPENLSVVRLMSRRYVDALLQHDEREIFLAGLWLITGYKQCPQTITKHSTSETTYTLRLKIAQLVNSIVSFSNAPLVAIFVSGCFITLISLVFALYLVWGWVANDRPPSGWTSVIMSIWLLGGITISFVGVIGIYLAKIFSETKRRPYTIVRHIYRQGGAA